MRQIRLTCSVRNDSVIDGYYIYNV